MRDVTITTVLNGWVVTVGCQRVAFVDKNIMLDEISKYLDSPYETEKRYREEAINAKHAFKEAVAEEDESDVARDEHFLSTRR